MSKYLNEWLFTNIDYDNTYYIKDVMNEMFSHIINFVNRFDDLNFDYTIDDTKQAFYQCIYHHYYQKQSDNFDPYDIDMYDYFCDSYSQDIIDIYFRLKEISKRNNLDLFHKQQDHSLPLQDFLFTHVLIADPYYDSESDSESENNIDINIDESEL